MILEATHRTRYVYPSPSRESHNEVRLMPLTDESQTCLLFSLDVRPGTPVFSYKNPGGTVHHFGVREPHETLEVVATACVETLRKNPYEGLDLLGEDWSFYASEEARQAHAEFLCDSPYVNLSKATERITAPLRQSTASVAGFLIQVNAHIHDLLVYDTEATHVHSTVDEVMSKRAGVCQDYAHLMIACCRSQGIPTRYVSGYLYGGEGIRGEQATHAWIDCLLPDGRWLSLDPTNNILAHDHHIRVHTGRDYTDVAPARGVYVGPPASVMDVSVTVVAQEPAIA